MWYRMMYDRWYFLTAYIIEYLFSSCCFCIIPVICSGSKVPSSTSIPTYLYSIYIEARVAKGVEEKLKVCGAVMTFFLIPWQVTSVLEFSCVYSDCQMTPKWRGVGQRQHSFPPIFASQLTTMYCSYPCSKFEKLF